MGNFYVNQTGSGLVLIPAPIVDDYNRQFGKREPAPITFYCDDKRHLICEPYTVENLHRMAAELGIKRCWYRKKGRNLHPHYDIPVKMVNQVRKRCTIITERALFLKIKEALKNS